MAKRVRLSSDNGTTWYTLPGSEAEMTYEAGDLDDTIFGQSFRSQETGLIDWQVTANSYYKGFAGYNVDIKKIGASSTAMVAEPAALVSGKTYQITNATKRIMDKNTAITVLGNGIAIAAANILNIDYLFGRVTFQAAYTPSTPITITNAYWATSVVAKGRSFTLTMTAEPVDNSTFETAQANGGHRVFSYGLKTVTLEVAGVFDATNDFQDLVKNRAETIIEIDAAGTGASVARGFFKPMSQNQSGPVGDLEEETISFSLSVPAIAADNLAYPFGWLHTSSTLSTAVQTALTAWANETTIDVEYSWDGTNGKKGDCIITECTMTAGIEAMVEFSVTCQGTGTTTDVP